MKQWFDQLRPASDPLGVSYVAEVDVPSQYYHPYTGINYLYRIDLACQWDCLTVGGVEVTNTHATDAKKWGFYQMWGYDVIEVDMDWILHQEVMPLYIPYTCATFRSLGVNNRKIHLEHPMFTRRPYASGLAGYPPLHNVQVWESHPPVKTLLEYDAKIGVRWSDATQTFLAYLGGTNAQ